MINLRYKLNKATIKHCTQYTQLLSIISKQFGLDPSTFHITYLDDDQDHISITNQDDITTMVQTTSIFELYVHDKEEIADSILCDNLLNLTTEENNTIQGLNCSNLERIKKNMEEYLGKMEKVWGDFKIENGLSDQEQNDFFLNATIQLVESKQIGLFKDIEQQFTEDISQQKNIQKLIDERINDSIPMITTMIEKSLMSNSMSISSQSPNTGCIIDKAHRLKHKRITKLMERYPSIPILDLTKIVQDTLDLEYDEIVTKLAATFTNKSRQ